MLKKCKFSVADDLASRKARLAAKSVPQVKHFLPASNGAHHKKTPKKYARMIRFVIGDVRTGLSNPVHEFRTNMSRYGHSCL